MINTHKLFKGRYTFATETKQMTSEDTEEKEPKPKTLKEKTYVFLFCVFKLLYNLKLYNLLLLLIRIL